MKLLRLSRIVIFLFLMPVVVRASEIRISNQADFDRLGEMIVRHIQRGDKDISVNILPGRYLFSEGHIFLGNQRCGDVSLSITGRDVVITGAGKEGPFDLNTGLIDVRTQTAAPLFRDFKQALAIAEILDTESGLCRMAVDEAPVVKRKAKNMYILITQWYLAKYYKVTEIKDGYVYFLAPGATDDRSASTSPNADFRYGKVLPRYTFLNHPKSKDVPVFKKRSFRSPSGTRIARCDAGCFLKISWGEFRSVKISGIKFLGSGGTGPLINFYHCSLKDGAKVDNCVFDGIKGDVLWAIAAPSVTFSDNIVRNCHANGVVVSSGTRSAVITKNKFYNNGLDVKNYFCVKCQGIDFLVADNYFEDFTYGAIGVGIWYATIDDVLECSGIVERNECCYSPSYNSGVFRNLMDSGAIYTWTINTDVTIRNNYVHDISGPGENRGIFCDDGTVNVKILNNKVERISNSYCIDLRRALSIETAKGSRISRVNVGNVMEGNVVDGKVRFERRDK